MAVISVVAALLAAGPLAAGESRWYLVGKVGQASVEQEFGPPVFGWRFDDEDATGSVEVGFGLHRYLAVQAAYHDFGDHVGLPRPCPPGAICPLVLNGLPQLVPIEPVSASFTALSLSAVPRWPVTERISVYGKLGILDWDGTLQSSSLGQRLDPSSGRELLAGIGAQYAFRQGLGVLLEYERSDLFDALSLGASWRF